MAAASVVDLDKNALLSWRTSVREEEAVVAEGEGAEEPAPAFTRMERFFL